MTSRPRVLVNMAMTADGKIDTVARRGARISGPADSARVDRLRAEADAVMVGGRTLLAEDPSLAVRDERLRAARERDGRPPQPAKVGVVSLLEPPGAARALPEGDFLGQGGGRLILCTTSRSPAGVIDRLRDRGVEVIVHGEERVDLAASLTTLATMGIGRLMVEGGSTLVASLLEAGLVDELQLAIAPLLFGGEAAPTPVGGPGWTRDEAIPLALADTTLSPDGDVVLCYQLPTGAPT